MYRTHRVQRICKIYRTFRSMDCRTMGQNPNMDQVGSEISAGLRTLSRVRTWWFLLGMNKVLYGSPQSAWSQLGPGSLRKAQMNSFLLHRRSLTVGLMIWIRPAASQHAFFSILMDLINMVRVQGPGPSTVPVQTTHLAKDAQIPWKHLVVMTSSRPQPGRTF